MKTNVVFLDQPTNLIVRTLKMLGTILEIHDGLYRIVSTVGDTYICVQVDEFNEVLSIEPVEIRN